MSGVERFMGISFLIASLIFASTVSAQDAPGYSSDPNSTINDGTNINAPSTTTSEDNFSWWWLLPLAFIPLVLLIPWNKSEETRVSEYNIGDPRLAYRGVKGGRVSRTKKNNKRSPKSKTIRERTF